MDHPALLTAAEAAEKLGISKHRVYRRIHRGDLKAIPTTRGFRIPLDELQAYIDADRVDQLTEAKRPRADWMSTSEVASLTGFSPETIRAMCRKGRLAFIKGNGTGGQLRISRDSVTALIG